MHMYSGLRAAGLRGSPGLRGGLLETSAAIEMGGPGLRRPHSGWSQLFPTVSLPPCLAQGQGRALGLASALKGSAFLTCFRGDSRLMGEAQEE